jgi:hypothetical protein
MGYIMDRKKDIRSKKNTLRLVAYLNLNKDKAEKRYNINKKKK